MKNKALKLIVKLSMLVMLLRLNYRFFLFSIKQGTMKQTKLIYLTIVKIWDGLHQNLVFACLIYLKTSQF